MRSDDRMNKRDVGGSGSNGSIGRIKGDKRGRIVCTGWWKIGYPCSRVSILDVVKEEGAELAHNVHPFHVFAIHPKVGNSRYPASTTSHRPGLLRRFITSHNIHAPTE